MQNFNRTRRRIPGVDSSFSRSPVLLLPRFPVRHGKTITLGIFVLGVLSGTPVAQEPAAPQTGKFATRAKAFVDQLSKGEFAQALEPFDATMRRVVPEEKLKKIWAGVVAKAGPFKRQVGARTEKSGPHEAVFVTCEFGKGRLDVKIVFNREGQIAGLFFTPSRTPATPARIAELTASAEKFVEQLAAGEFAQATGAFDTAMRRAMPQDKLKKTWEALLAQTGPFQKQTGDRNEKVRQYDVVFVTCQFEKTKMDVKVVFNEAGDISGLFFVPTGWEPPDYAKPESFQEKEVVVGSGKWSLPGTLTMPAGAGPFPAVVLVHGSGPNDRDETLGPNKPFRDMAWGLASRGIAVLRYDKRTKVHGLEMVVAEKPVTVKEETIDDALAAVELLRTTPGIDPKLIFVAGHSLGGMLVPRIGMRDKDIAGFIVLAGTTRPFEDVIMDQRKYIASLDGKISPDEQKMLDECAAQVARVKDPKLSEKTPASELPTGVSAAYWLALRGYRPGEVAKGLRRPMLILQGGRDYQVTKEDFNGWKKSLMSQPNVQFNFYPSLNHLFIRGEGTITPAEYAIPGHVAEMVVRDMALWIE